MGQNSNLKFNIITPSKVVYSDYVRSVYFCDDKGDIVILNNYEPTIGKIKRSLIEIIDIQGRVFEYIIDNGIYSVADCELNFLASFCIENTEEQKNEILSLKEKTLNVLSDKKLNMQLNQELLIFKKLKNIKRK